MARKKRKKHRSKKRNSEHFEVKALLFFSLALFVFTSLLSFRYQVPSANWLGILGYYLSLSLHYLFGLGSYVIGGYFFWISWKLFREQKTQRHRYRISFFAIFLFSFCMLLNIIAEKFPESIANLEPFIYTESATLYNPSPVIYYRFNLGGVPFYYVYVDFPFLNLKKLLSDVGVAMIFSTTLCIAFLLLTQIKVKQLLFNALYFLSPVFKKIFSFFTKKRPFPKSLEKVQKPPMPIIEKPKRFFQKKTTTPITSEPVIHTLEEKIYKNSKLPIKKISPMRFGPDCKNYRLPSADLLTPAKAVDHPTLKKDLKIQAKVLENALLSFGIKASVGEIHCGPTITSFEVQPPVGVKVQKIKALENDIALNLQAKSIRIIAPIPGKAAVGVEIPSIHPQEVNFKEMLQYYQGQARKLHIPLLLGKTVSGDSVIADLAKMPHCLIAGATGSGKSVCINTLVMSILMNAHPDEVKMVMIDPKKVELTQYSSLPHMIAPVISEAHGAYAALQWLVSEMQSRYEILKGLGLRNITTFNQRKRKKEEEESIPEKLPLIVCIVDEFADLMMVSSSDLETPIARIAQMARAVGIHLVLATQRPSREVITGIIKANIPTRIAFKVASRINSQIILDETGAESLLGNGDMLFLPPGSSQLVRAQGAFISDHDINQCVETICAQAPVNYLIKSFDAMRKEEAFLDSHSRDEFYDEAIRIVVQTKNASTTFLQRKLKIGYARAASLMDEMEKNGVIGPQEKSKPRRILLEPSDINSK